MAASLLVVVRGDGLSFYSGLYCYSCPGASLAMIFLVPLACQAAVTALRLPYCLPGAGLNRWGWGRKNSHTLHHRKLHKVDGIQNRIYTNGREKSEGNFSQKYPAIDFSLRLVLTHHYYFPIENLYFSWDAVTQDIELGTICRERYLYSGYRWYQSGELSVCFTLLEGFYEGEKK